MARLAARGETLEERRERRAQKRAAHISARFGYTAEENPFNDPNLHEAFTWKKREQKVNVSGAKDEDKRKQKKSKGDKTFSEIEKVRQRRKDRELQFEEMERIRAEESRMKELENYDEWARKEEEFHLQQQRQRSAIRLVEGREKPIDVLAKNILLFGLSEEEKESRASVKYKEKFNALEAIESLEAELDEPQKLLKMLKLNELEELLVDIDAFRALEREAHALASRGDAMMGLLSDDENPVLHYWDALYVVALDEIKFLKSGGADGSHAKMARDIEKIFKGQSPEDLIRMQKDVQQKLSRNVSAIDAESGEAFDRDYWNSVNEQLTVYLSKLDLSRIHSKMLVRQLERLEARKEELAKKAAAGEIDEKDDGDDQQASESIVPTNVAPGFGDLEEELGATDEVEQQKQKQYSWQDKYRPRKPRYFNRVKTGYDWNKYNQTHYDKDNPPPKTVQGCKYHLRICGISRSHWTCSHSLELIVFLLQINLISSIPTSLTQQRLHNSSWNRPIRTSFALSVSKLVRPMRTWLSKLSIENGTDHENGDTSAPLNVEFCLCTLISQPTGTGANWRTSRACANSGKTSDISLLRRSLTWTPILLTICCPATFTSRALSLVERVRSSRPVRLELLQKSLRGNPCASSGVLGNERSVSV